MLSAEPETDALFSRSQRLLFLMVVLAYVTSCVDGPSARSPDTFVARLPILDFCAADAETRVANISEYSDFEGDYVRFDGELRGHPYIAGYVELRSSVREEEELLALARGLSSECLLRYERVFEKNSPADAAALFEFLNTLEQGSVRIGTLEGGADVVDPQKVFLINDGDLVRVIFGVN